MWGREIGNQKDVDEILGAGALQFLWPVRRGVGVNLLGDMLIEGDHRHLDGLDVGEVQEARDG